MTTTAALGFIEQVDSMIIQNTIIIHASTPSQSIKLQRTNRDTRHLHTFQQSCFAVTYIYISMYTSYTQFCTTSTVSEADPGVGGWKGWPGKAPPIFHKNFCCTCFIVPSSGTNKNTERVLTWCVNVFYMQQQQKSS